MGGFRNLLDIWWNGLCDVTSSVVDCGRPSWSPCLEATTAVGPSYSRIYTYRALLGTLTSVKKNANQV